MFIHYSSSADRRALAIVMNRNAMTKDLSRVHADKRSIVESGKALHVFAISNIMPIIFSSLGSPPGRPMMEKVSSLTFKI